MIIGFDIGGSATKVAGLRGEEIAFTHYETNREKPASAVLEEALAASCLDAEIERIALTGVGAGRAQLERFGAPVTRVSEIEAIGLGGTWLSGEDDAVIASLGTGTAFVLAKGGEFTHLGGTGIGAGTLCGLGGKILGTRDAFEIDELSKRGRLENVDLRISDLFPGEGTIFADLTASNLARGERASREDWAMGIVNLVLQAVGSMAMLACGGRETKTVVITGALARLGVAPDAFSRFERAYGLKYTIARHPKCATAIGAARRSLMG